MKTESLTALRSLVAVVECGSIVAAASLTGYSAAAVSRHLSGLERDLRLPLFERSGRSLRPSVLARVVAEKAVLLLDEADQFDRSVSALAKGDDGVVRLAYFRAVGTTLLPGILREFSLWRPHARLVLTECALSEEVETLLRRGEVDVGFTWGFPDSEAPDLETLPVISDALVLLTALDREDLHERPGDLARLAGENFSSAAVHRGSPPIVDEMFRACGLPAPTVTHRLSDHAMSKALIAAGVVISLIPALGISDAAVGVRRSIVVDDFRRVYFARGRTGHPLAPVIEKVVVDAVREYHGFGVTSLV